MSQIDTLIPPKSELAPSQKEIVKGALQDPLSSMRVLTKGSLYYFMQYFWDTYSQETFSPNWHIKEICKELEAVARRVAEGEKKEYDLIINVPPGTTKTATVSVFFPVWCWANWYWMKFITSSHSSDLSNESAEYSREIIRSEKFQAMFPEIDIKPDKDVKSNYRIVKKEYISPGQLPRLKSGGGRISTSVDARITGFHAHIIIPDDIIDPKRALSEVGLVTAQNHLKTLSSRKVNKRVTTTIMIMQRLHQEDPTGYMLEKQKDNIRHICLPGELGEYAQFVKPQEFIEFYKDGLLDVNRLGRDELKDLEADLGQYGYAGQVGQNPTPPGGGMFKVNMLNVIDSLSSETNIVRTIRYWDKAGTQDGGTYTAGVKMSLMQNKKYVIHDVKRGQWGTDEREKVIKATTEADGKRVTVIIEQEGGSGGKESAESTVKNLAGYTVHRDIPRGDKALRADPFSVQVNWGNVILLRGDWNKAFVDELEMFPNGKYKDQVDSASAGFNLLSGKKQVKVGR
jgi:predicted phage terminase large subunit-like protein